MTKAEQMTRAAARMIGRDVTGYVWNEKVLGLEGKVGLHDQPDIFSPLTDPGDAFMVEGSLPVSVKCEYHAGGRIALYASTPITGLEDLGYMTSARADLVVDVLRARMLLVTQFAELAALAQE